MMRPLQLLAGRYGGRSDAVRLAFIIGNVQFEDHFVRGHQAESPEPILALRLGTRVYRQYEAILSYAAKLGGFLPEEPVRLMIMWQAIRALQPCWTIAEAVHREQKKSQSELTELRLELAEELAKYERLVSHHQHSNGFMAGDSVSPADLDIYAFVRYCLSPEVGMSTGFVYNSVVLRNSYHAVLTLKAVDGWHRGRTPEV